MRGFISLYEKVNILSLDVVLGAVACALFFAKVNHSGYDVNVLVVLAATVWIIYTTDHLLDARKISGLAVTSRHAFHQRFFKPIAIVLLLVIVIDGFLILQLPPTVVKHGILLGLLVVIYLLTNAKLWMIKELVSASLYTLGILVTVSHIQMSNFTLLLMLQFFTVVLMNLILFSWFDAEKDQSQNTKSMVTFLGKLRCVWIIAFLFLINIFIAIVNFSTPSVVVLVMGVSHMIFLTAGKYFIQHDRYRHAGDAVFFLPAVYLVVDYFH